MIVLPTAYFPEIRYLSLLKKNRAAILDLGEHFIKQTIRNRTMILGANGPLKLIVPLEKWRNNTPVKDIRISYADSWQKLHWKSIESAYRNSPYFEYYEEKLRRIILEEKENFLQDLNMKSLEFILDAMKLEVTLETSLEYLEDIVAPDDFRLLDRNTEYQTPSLSSYIQVFEQPEGFVNNLGAIDLICNNGPGSISHL